MKNRMDLMNYSQYLQTASILIKFLVVSFRKFPKPSKKQLKVSGFTDKMPLPLKGFPASRVLKEGCQQLKTYDIHHWLSSGTVIGLYRDKKLIPFDTDLDINILVDINRPFSINLKGFKLIRTIYYDNLPMQTAFIKNSVIFDIYYFYTGIKWRKAVNFNEYGVIEKPMSFVYKLSKLTFNGVNYPIPNQIEKFLKWRFGNWKVPRKNKQPWEKDATHLKPY